VIPKAHPEVGGDPLLQQGSCGLDFAGGPGPCTVGGGGEVTEDAGDGHFDLRDHLTRHRGGTRQ
jgi:hypothetical protein